MRPFQRCAVALLLILSLLSSACVATLPPPPAPSAADVPANVALLPSSPGKGRVLLEATNGPASVDEVVAHENGVVYGRRGTWSTESEVTRPVCTETPCAANLDYGPHDLRFHALTGSDDVGDARVNVGTGDSAVLSTMGRQTSGGAGHAAGILALYFGASALAAGTAMTGVAAAQDDGNKTVLYAGGATLGIGAGLAVLGAVLVLLDRPAQQEGSSAQYPLND